MAFLQAQDFASAERKVFLDKKPVFKIDFQNKLLN